MKRVDLPCVPCGSKVAIRPDMEIINFSCGCKLAARPGAGYTVTAKSAVSGAHNSPISPTYFSKQPKQTSTEYAQKVNLVKIINKSGDTQVSTKMQRMFCLSPLVVENRVANEKR